MEEKNTASKVMQFQDGIKLTEQERKEVINTMHKEYKDFKEIKKDKLQNVIYDNKFTLEKNIEQVIEKYRDKTFETDIYLDNKFMDTNVIYTLLECVKLYECKVIYFDFELDKKERKEVADDDSKIQSAVLLVINQLNKFAGKNAIENDSETLEMCHECIDVVHFLHSIRLMLQYRLD